MLTNEQKSGIILLLAAIDKNLSLSTFNMPHVNNAKKYFINSKDEEINISIDGDNLQGLTRHFGKVINYILMHSDIEIEEEDSPSEIVAKILNSYLEEDLICEEALDNLNKLRDYSNKTTSEDKILDIASSLGILAFCNLPLIHNNLTGEDIEDDLVVADGIYIHDNREYLSSCGVDWINLNKVTNAQLQKTDLERIKYLLMAAISGDMHLEIAGNTKLENIRDCFLYGVNKNGLPHEFYLHNRTSSDIDTQILKEKIYKTILDGINVENKSKEEKDQIVIELLQEDIKKRFTPKQFKGHLSYLQDMIFATLDTNMGRERLLMETFTMTLATLILDMNLPIAKIPRANQIARTKYTSNHFEQIIQANYELLKRDRTLFQSFLNFYNEVIRARKLTLDKLERGERLNLTNLDMLSDNLLPLKNAVKDLVYEEKNVYGTEDLRNPDYIKEKLLWIAQLKKRIKNPNTTSSEHEDLAKQIIAFLKEETTKANAIGISRKDVIKLFGLEELFFPKEDTDSFEKEKNNTSAPKPLNLDDSDIPDYTNKISKDEQCDDLNNEWSNEVSEFDDDLLNDEDEDDFDDDLSLI